MVYQIVHLTRYSYQAEVALSYHLARLRPRTLPHQQTLGFELVIQPTPALRHEWTDYHGNHATFFAIETAHHMLEVVARSRVAVQPRRLPEPDTTPPWDVVAELRLATRLSEETQAAEFAFASPLVEPDPSLANYASPSFPKGRPLLEAALELMQRIHTDFEFDPTATTVATPMSEAFHQRRGVCQDFAHIMIGCLRSLGLPARYVSGYLETHPPAGQPRLQGVDASHAWVSLYCPGSGWVDLDPTNNLLPNAQHVTIGWGRDYSDVSPIRGVLMGSGDHALSVAVDVIAESENESPAPPPEGAT